MLNIKARGGAGDTNQAPVAENLNLTIDEGEVAEVTLSGSDEDRDSLEFTLLSQPTNGELSGTAPNLIYTPSENFTGVDSFTYVVNDGTLNSEVATVTITVVPVNDAPVARALSVETPEDTEVGIVLSGSDPDEDVLTYFVLTQPSNGTLSGTAPNLIYAPSEDFNGLDSFTYKVNDGELDSDVATVAITITPLNDKPEAVAQALTTPEDTALNITLAGSDPDGSAVNYIIVDQPANGTLSGDVPNVIYTPSINYNGPDSFTYKVNDGELDSDVVTVAITVVPGNDAPIASALTLTTPEDTAVAVALSGTDSDGDALTCLLYTSPSPRDATLSRMPSSA